MANTNIDPAFSQSPGYGMQGQPNMPVASSWPSNQMYSGYNTSSSQNIRPGFINQPPISGAIPPAPASMASPNYGQVQPQRSMGAMSQGGPTPTLNQLLQGSSSVAMQYQKNFGPQFSSPSGAGVDPMAGVGQSAQSHQMWQQQRPMPSSFPQQNSPYPAAQSYGQPPQQQQPFRQQGTEGGGSFGPGGSAPMSGHVTQGPAAPDATQPPQVSGPGTGVASENGGSSLTGTSGRTGSTPQHPGVDPAAHVHISTALQQSRQSNSPMPPPRPPSIHQDAATSSAIPTPLVSSLQQQPGMQSSPQMQAMSSQPHQMMPPPAPMGGPVGPYGHPGGGKGGAPPMQPGGQQPHPFPQYASAQQQPGQPPGYNRPQPRMPGPPYAGSPQQQQQQQKHYGAPGMVAPGTPQQQQPQPGQYPQAYPGAPQQRRPQAPYPGGYDPNMPPGSAAAPPHMGPPMGNGRPGPPPPPIHMGGGGMSGGMRVQQAPPGQQPPPAPVPPHFPQQGTAVTQSVVNPLATSAVDSRPCAPIPGKEAPKKDISQPATPSSFVAPSPSGASSHDGDDMKSPSWPNTPLGSQKVESRLMEFGDEPGRQVFVQRLLALCEERNTPLTANPTVCKQPLDLFKCYMLVKERGMSLEVLKNKKWKEVATTLGIGTSASASNGVKKNYLKFLLAYECRYDRDNADPAPILAQLEARKNKAANKAAAQAAAQAAAVAGGTPPNGQQQMNMYRPPSNAQDGYRPPSAGMMGGPQGGPWPAQHDMMNGPMQRAPHPNMMQQQAKVMGPQGGYAPGQMYGRPSMQQQPGMQQQQAQQNGMVMGQQGQQGAYQGQMMHQQQQPPQQPGMQPSQGGNMMQGHQMPNSSGMMAGMRPTHPHQAQQMGTPQQQGRMMQGPRMPHHPQATSMGGASPHQGGMMPQQPSMSGAPPNMGAYPQAPKPQSQYGPQMGQSGMTNGGVMSQAPSSSAPGVPPTNGTVSSYEQQQPGGKPQAAAQQPPQAAHQQLPSQQPQPQMNMAGAQLPAQQQQQSVAMPQQPSTFPPPPHMPQGPQGPYPSPAPPPHDTNRPSLPPQGSTPQMPSHAPPNSSQFGQQHQRFPIPRPQFPMQSMDSRPIPTAASHSTLTANSSSGGTVYTAGGGLRPPAPMTPQQQQTPPPSLSRAATYGTPPPPQLPPANTGFGGSPAHSASNYPTPKGIPGIGDKSRLDGQWGSAAVNRSTSYPGGRQGSMPGTPKFPNMQKQPHQQSRLQQHVRRNQLSRGSLPFGSAKKVEPLFPPKSVEATAPKLVKRKRRTARHIGQVDPWRVMMALRSGLLAESTWALDVLNVLLYDDGTVAYFHLTHLPGLLDTLLDYFRRILIDVFDDFRDLEIRPEEGSALDKSPAPAVPPPESEAKVKAEPCTSNNKTSRRSRNYTLKTRQGKPVLVEEDSKRHGMMFDTKAWDLWAPGFSADSSHWEEGFGETTDHIETHFESDCCIKVLRKEFLGRHADYLGQCGVQVEEEEKTEDDEEEAHVPTLSCMKCSTSSSSSGGKGESSETSSVAPTASSPIKVNCCPSELKAGGDVKTEPADTDCEMPQLEYMRPDESHSVDGDNFWDNAPPPPAEKVTEEEEEPSRGIKRKAEDEGGRQEEEEEVYEGSEGPFHLKETAQESLMSRCLCVAKVLRNLSFVPGNDKVMANHTGLILLLGRLLLHGHEHRVRHVKSRKHRRYMTDDDDANKEVAQEDEEEVAWWWECLPGLREHVFVILVNVSSRLRLEDVPEHICLPVLQGLLHWLICPSSLAQDPLPSLAHTPMSPRRLALETLSKLCIHGSNVDLLLATPLPGGTSNRGGSECMMETLAKMFSTEDQVGREMALVLMSQLSRAEDNVCALLARKPQLAPLLVDFLERAEHQAVQAASSHGVKAVKDNPVCLGTTPGMLHHSAAIVRAIAILPENKGVLKRVEDRVLGLAMSQVLDSNIKHELSEVLFALQASS